jgi:hypothetical protein
MPQSRFQEEMSATNLIALVSKLTMVPPDESLSMVGILAVCPDLSKNDWINRLGRDLWEAIAEHYATPVLERLIKVLVIAERELKWAGGSVAATVWLFWVYQRRTDADSDALADWIFRNKGNNYYLPFGFSSAARSLDEWRAEQAQKAEKAERWKARQKAEAEARLVERQEWAIRRRKSSQASKQEIERFIRHLESLTPEARFFEVAHNETMPLEALSTEMVSSLVEAVPQSTSEVRHRLLARIDRRQSAPWKQLRKLIRESN